MAPLPTDDPFVMDLVSAACSLQSARTAARFQVAAAKKVMDVQRQQGAAALKLLEAASTGVTQAGDSLVAAATGLGANLDTYA